MKANKILLLNPPISLEARYGGLGQAGYVEPPFGLCYLAAKARECGYEVNILDSQALNLSFGQTAEKIISYEPDCLGITATTQIIKSASMVAKEIKKIRPSIKVIIGGCHVTALPEETLKENPEFDIGVIGEGEDTLAELLQALNSNRDLSSVKGLIIRENGNARFTGERAFIRDLDSLPVPAFDLLPHLSKFYRISTQSVNNLPALSLITSRGCAGKCTFCDIKVHGSIPRKHSAGYIFNLMKDFRSRYGIKTILFEDDNLFFFKPRLRELTDMLARQRLDITWSCQTRADTVDLDSLKLAKKGGCWQVMFGIESGSQEILDFYKKGITLKQIRTAVKLTKKARLKAKGFFILGNPLESEQTLNQTINFIKELDLDDISITFFTPFPGSPIYKTAEQYGEFDKDWDKMGCFEPVFVPKGFTRQELEGCAKKAYKEFYSRPKIILSYLLRVKSIAQFRELYLSGLSLLRYYWRKK